MSRRQSPQVRQAFELGYLAAFMRLKREAPAMMRDTVVNALAKDALDRPELMDGGDAVREYSPHVAGLRLIVMRCHAAATMLSWRKEITAKQREALGEALGKLLGEAKRLGVEISADHRNAGAVRTEPPRSL
jgi:hypothetical protein